MAPIYKHLDHEPPNWVSPASDYFITVCAEPRKQNHFCQPERGKRILDSIRLYQEKGNWFCHLAVLMPDHVHLLVCFPPDKILSKVIGLWKRALTRSDRISWQRNFFEHRIRRTESMQEKWEYILQNPVRAGLIERAQDWAYVWRSDDPEPIRRQGQRRLPSAL